ncbi:MAG: hypothetical protein RMJ98_14780 [Myxococcales bacterium]|nr:hypothetical protein [Myxococcales bacterium]
MLLILLALGFLGVQIFSTSSLSPTLPKNREISEKSEALPISEVPLPVRISSSAAPSQHPAPSASVVVAHRIGFAPWGDGAPDRVGHKLPEEANAEGPMSLVVVGGALFVLDQVNDRITRWKDGKAQVVVELGGLEAADLAVAPDGSIAVLDRLVNKEVAIFKDGKRMGSLPLDPERFPEPGTVTGVFVEGEEVWVEKEHGPLIRLGTLSGALSNDQEELPGRPSRDGTLLLSAGIVDQEQGRAYVAAFDRAKGEARFTRQLTFPGVLTTIVALDSDRTGTIYLAVTVEQGTIPVTSVTCLEPARGDPLGAVQISTNTSPEESLRELTVGDDGTIVFAHRTLEGMVFESYRCP